MRHITAITRQAKEEIEWFLKEDAKMSRKYFMAILRLEHQYDNMDRVEKGDTPIDRIGIQIVKKTERKVINALRNASVGDNQEKEKVIDRGTA